MSILVTGGLGYIGSHTTVELLEAGYDVVVVDNLYNCKESVKNNIYKITGKNFKFYKYDLTNRQHCEKVFEENSIDAVIHFCAYKAVGESVERPLKYYDNNIKSTLVLLGEMNKYNVKKLVFSSSACVYGDSNKMPVKEEDKLLTTNPYGRTKLMIEDMLRDLYKSDNSWNISILRYFNPIGAHESGIIGEESNDIPNNLMPYITKVALGELKELSVFGNDYNTLDGSGVRDYIHVVDLAKGHIKALEKLREECGLVTYNLGTGKGVSVLELVNIFSKVNNIEVPYKIVGRRKGDVAECYADVTKANKELDWKATKTIEDMCRDSYKWGVKNKHMELLIKT